MTTVSLDHPARPSQSAGPARNLGSDVRWAIALLIFASMVIGFAFVALESSGVDVRPAINAASDLISDLLA